MNLQRKLSGRPKLTEGKRVKKITARFTEDEFSAIEELEKTLGVNKTDLLRMRLLTNVPEVAINAKEMITAIDAIGTELGRCGNNINQLAKYANILQKQNKLDQSVCDHFNKLLGTYMANQERLDIAMRQIIRAIGR